MRARKIARPTTLSDVARLAGVSPATASKALNGRDEVAPATRQRVIDAAERLAFSPNQLAKGLFAGRTGTVGLLTSDLEGRFVIPILMGAEDAFGAGQVNAFLCDARGDEIREQHHLRALLSRRIDGLIVVGRQTDPRPSLGHDLGVPVVYAYAPSDDETDLSITPDNVEAGRMAAEHLISLGRTRIAQISGDRSYAAARDRVTGANQAFKAAGLTPVGDVMFGDWSETWGRDAAAAMLAQHPEIDAVLCGSDQISRGVLDHLRDIGRSVPHDVAVMGFDNWLVLTTNARPQLSSIDANLKQLGRTAAERVFAALDGEDIGTGIELTPPRLVIRGSTVARLG
ncbi:LacI family transcriptional regulator [Actinotalea sp. M2MS4P-6]|uniref:LacI family DNA-binding transcriptional regulator n=1 Tax=Actinotalea sp. M2MS4P-6 TaxID=2983762 RepID=UPI0021E4E78E|nr:LacI family DNA-binding transcriptional regulator [Actinotalea sp. M2MS4P-6]MCV2393301.1 LacI family transcriptional regulator [Actinotalea sp. M2MS4P-6]